jgi:hypothetical protein
MPIPKNRLLNKIFSVIARVHLLTGLCPGEEVYPMTHDPNGRVAPPRCEECNTPLTSDEHHLTSASTHFFCFECQLVLNPFPGDNRRSRERKKRNSRPRADLPTASADHLVSGATA